MKTITSGYRRSILLAALLFLAVSSFQSCEKDEATPTTTNTGGTTGETIETMAPNFTLNDTDGNAVQLSTYKGKVVVLFFFGHSCPSCKGIAPKVQSELASGFESTGMVQVLGLDQWDGNTASVQAFKTSSSLTFPILQNASATATAYKSTYDRIVVIDKEGIIRFSGTQNVSSDFAAAKAVIEQYTTAR